MKNINIIKNQLSHGEFNDRLAYLYSCDEKDTQQYAKRFIKAADALCETFGDTEEIAFFSAPGRTEIGGNHTDHQHGCVLAGSINLDVIAAVRFNGTDLVRIQSEGYPMDIIDLNDLEKSPEQLGKSVALIKGVLKKFDEKGYKLYGFDAYTVSNVLKGSGLSSSAAFEVLIGTILNSLFANNELSAVEIAQIGQYAENVYFGKPSGLLDQMASSVGAVVAMDFMDTNTPIVRKVELDMAKYNHALCIIDSGADHADLTDEYAMIPADMKEVAAYFGKNYMREVDESDFMENIKSVRETINNDRAVLRAFHFLRDNRYAREEAEAIENGDFDRFLKLIKESGRSSYMYLQNVYASGNPKSQAVSVALALCDAFLGDRGAYRVHGGGFAGTVQAFVPFDILDDFKTKIEKSLGKGMCHVLSIRPVGGYELK